MRHRKLLRIVLILAILTLPGYSQAQHPNNVTRIGLLMTGVPPPEHVPLSENFNAFHAGLQKLGYVEGENLVVEYRYTEEKPERLTKFLEELIDLKVNAIVAPSTPAIHAAIQTSTEIPIVILSAAADPEAENFVDSLARPGGNITGVSGRGSELTGKLLELLTEAVPGRRMVGVLSHRVH